MHTLFMTSKYQMAINHVNNVTSISTTALAVNPNEETNSNKSNKKQVGVKKIRLQHPHQQGKEFEVNLVNDDDKLVCNLCNNTTSFEKMKSLYKHMKKAHSNVEWKTFLNTKLDMINEEAKKLKKKKVVFVDSVSMKPPQSWGLRRKRSDRIAVEPEPPVKKICNMEQDLGLIGAFSPDEFEAAEGLLLLSQPLSVTPRQQIQEEAKESEGVKFDLNQPPPPMDMEVEAVCYSLEEFTGCPN